MATFPNTKVNYLNAFNSLVPNPGKRFITGQDELNFLNQAALTIAAELGGLEYYYDFQPVGEQQEYTLPNHIIQVRSPAYDIDYINSGIEAVAYLDVLTWNEADAFKSNVEDDPATPAEYPDRVLRYDAHTRILRVLPPFEGTAGVAIPDKTVRLMCWGNPQEFFANDVVLHDGDVNQMNAVALEAASLARIRSRDIQESQFLHARAMEAADNAAKAKSIKNRITRVRMGQDTPNSRWRHK